MLHALVRFGPNSRSPSSQVGVEQVCFLDAAAGHDSAFFSVSVTVAAAAETRVRRAKEPFASREATLLGGA